MNTWRKHLYLFPLPKPPFPSSLFQTSFNQRTSVCFLRPLCSSFWHHLPYIHSAVGQTGKAYCPVLPPSVLLSMEWARGNHIAWNEGHSPFETVSSRQHPAATQKGGSAKQPAISMGRLQPEWSLPRPSAPRSQATHLREEKRKRKASGKTMTSVQVRGRTQSRVKPWDPSYMENDAHTTQ